MSNKFLDPLWQDPESKQRVRARQEGDDKEIIIDRSDTVTWDALMKEHSEEDIEQNTQDDIKRFREERDKRQAMDADNAERQFQEMLFAEKLAAFEIPEVKWKPDPMTEERKLLKRRLRKASTMAQVYVYAASLVFDYDNSEKNDEPNKT
tara:strand:+ start:2896 stop:3345 length:450 start_codon:yes stop_codon:yes gene_type:complete